MKSFFLELHRKRHAADQIPEVLCRVVSVGSGPPELPWRSIISLLIKLSVPAKSCLCADSAELYFTQFARKLRLRVDNRSIASLMKPSDEKLAGAFLVLNLDDPNAFIGLLTEVEEASLKNTAFGRLNKLIVAFSSKQTGVSEFSKVVQIGEQRHWKAILITPIGSNEAAKATFDHFLGQRWPLLSSSPEFTERVEVRRPTPSPSPPMILSELAHATGEMLHTTGDILHTTGSLISKGTSTLLGLGGDLDWDPFKRSPSPPQASTSSTTAHHSPEQPRARPHSLSTSVPSFQSSSSSSSSPHPLKPSRESSLPAIGSNRTHHLHHPPEGQPQHRGSLQLVVTPDIQSFDEELSSENSSSSSSSSGSSSSSKELPARFLESGKITHGVLPDSPLFFKGFDPLQWVKFGYPRRPQTDYRLSCASFDGWLPPAWKMDTALSAKKHVAAWRDLSSLLQAPDDGGGRFEQALRSIMERHGMSIEQLLALENAQRLGTTVLHVAKPWQVEVIGRLFPRALDQALNSSHCSNLPPLHYASSTCNLELLVAFSRWTDFSPLDYKSRSCLYHACMRRTGSTTTTTDHNDGEQRLLKVVDFLIGKCPAAVNMPAADSNRTPIFVALLEGHTAVVELLISCGASLRLCDVHGQSPLHIALSSDSIRLVELVARTCPVLIHQRFWAQNVDSGLLQLSPYQDAVNRCRNKPNGRIMLDHRAMLDSQVREALVASLAEVRRVEETFQGDVPSDQIDRAVTMYTADYVQHMVFELQAIFGDEPKFTKRTSPITHWLSSFRYVREGVWPDDTDVDNSENSSEGGGQQPSRTRSAFAFSYAFAHFGNPVLSWLYDQEFGVQNAFLLQFQKWLIEQNPLSLAVNPKHVKIWWPKTPPVDPAHAAKAQLAAKAVDDAVAALQQFLEAAYPPVKIRHLERFFEILNAAVTELTGGEGDPDFLLFIRAWVISKVSVPNVASIYAYVVDWLLKGQDPSEDFERPFAYPLFQLQTIIETIRAMRDTTTYLVAQIEARFRGVMTRCLPRDVELFRTICANLDTSKATQYRFPDFGANTASLQWFAQDWDLTIEQHGNDAVVTINNPAEFPLRPHICEAVSLKMASFTN